MNLYTYCESDPIDNIDPSGYDTLSDYYYSTGQTKKLIQYEKKKAISQRAKKTSTPKSTSGKVSDTSASILQSTVTSTANSKTLANYIDKLAKETMEVTGKDVLLETAPKFAGYIGKSLTVVSLLSNIHDLQTEKSPYKLTCTYGSLVSTGVPLPVGAVTDLGFTVLKESYNYQSKQTQDALDKTALILWKTASMSGTGIAK